MSKVVYLIEQPLDDWNYGRFGVQSWIDRGWEAEVWDLTPLSYPRVWREHFRSGSKTKEFAGYFPVVTRQQLEQLYSRQQPIEYLIDFTGDTYCSIRTKFRLTQMGAIRVICSTGTIPGASEGRPSDFGSKLTKAFTAGPIKSLKLLTNAIVRKVTAPYIRAGVTIVSGQKSIPVPVAGRETEIIKAHNLDYDVYLKIVNSDATSAEEYAVFIDQDYCFHPEYIYQDCRAVTPETYFPAVCKGLRRISHVLGTGLRVAAHPRATYRQRAIDYFEGIPIEYGRTAELIRNCKVVVCHDSTAIQFAVLFEKPVIFVTTNELESLFYDFAHKSESLPRFASALGKSVINLDADMDTVDWERELSFDPGKYSEYKRNYIKIDGSPELPYWDIVIGQLERDKLRLPGGA